MGRDYSNQAFPSVTEITDVMLPSEWKQYWFANSVAEAALEAVPPFTRQSLLKEAARRRNEVSNRATGFGGRIHKAMEHFLRKPNFMSAADYLQTDEELQVFSKFTSQLADRRLACVAIEEKLESPELRLNGTPDLVADEDGCLVLLDWKTSKKMDKLSYSYQMGGYCLLWKATKGVFIPRAEVLRVGKDGEVGKPLVIQNLEDWAVKFHKLRSVYYDITGK